jgi:hypothetical protein
MKSATDMDKQTKSEFRFFKIFGITFPVLCVFGFVVVLSMNWIEDSALKPFIEAMQYEDANVVLCNSQNLDLQKVREILDKKTRTKAKGSHPTSRIKLLVESQGMSSEIEISQDSRNNSLFWLYSEATQINGINIGFINSDYLAEKINGCI